LVTAVSEVLKLKDSALSSTLISSVSKKSFRRKPLNVIPEEVVIDYIFQSVCLSLCLTVFLCTFVHRITEKVLVWMSEYGCVLDIVPHWKCSTLGRPNSWDGSSWG